ncbi:periplasmic heavy metal sensor [Octadecabacter sp. 1_MG-2023]|uniref:periplasmic heavy metal sensor n=1 Tax=unclassified Octadecabacter TaxID=196158 RepID=UPI001C0975B7|nr:MULTISPECIES: periplasmic heavy metal sensor [unclassified Octadecabacter]MBU2992693.1 periplasmic heavy metal sensor [Octadecabacter sp. B2R22]MDO6733856.1 periplasmic heavy metal sensor [Octadecabacter sp. 1_MG-2023]
MANEQGKTKRWRRVLLVSSLALNLVVLGVVAGVVLNGGPPGSSQRFDLTAGPLTRAMDDDNRTAVRTALRESDVFQRRDRSEMEADMQALVATIRAETFDSEKFLEILERQRHRLQVGQDAVLDVVSAEISNMSSQERAAFADRLERQSRQAPPPREDRRAPRKN